MPSLADLFALWLLAVVLVFGLVAVVARWNAELVIRCIREWKRDPRESDR